MIEFTIPLTRRLRNVIIADSSARPPASLRLELARFQQQDSNGYRANSSGVAPTHSDHLTDPDSSAVASRELGQELERLQNQCKLFKSATDELTQASKHFDRRITDMMQELQVAAVEVAHAIAAKLIFDDIDANRFPIANLVHEVISRLDTQATSTVRLHPDDLALIEDQVAIGGSDDEPSVHFVADSTLARGDCKAKSGEVSVVYELRRQIDELRRQLLSTVNGHAES